MGRTLGAVIASMLFGVAACGSDASPRVVTTTVATGPSQSLAAAQRDGVIAELAALRLTVRSRREATLHTREGAWVVSRPSRALETKTIDDGCRLGPEDGEYGRDTVCTIEYGEILLIGDSGKVRRAFPMPGLPPQWIHATKHAVFGGRQGDGCLPDSSLFRIDRRSFMHQLIVFPGTAAPPNLLLPSWRVATQDEASRYHDLVGTPAGVKVTSAHGELRVDIDRVASLFAAAAPGVRARGEGSC